MDLRRSVLPGHNRYFGWEISRNKAALEIRRISHKSPHLDGRVQFLACLYILDNRSLLGSFVRRSCHNNRSYGCHEYGHYSSSLLKNLSSGKSLCFFLPLTIFNIKIKPCQHFCQHGWRESLKKSVKSPRRVWKRFVENWKRYSFAKSRNYRRLYDGGKFHPPHNTIIKLIKTSVNVATLWRQYLRSLITFILGKLNNFKTLFPASSVDRYLVTAFYQKMKKKTVEGSINFCRGNAQFKKMRTCSKRQYTNSQIILNKKKDLHWNRTRINPPRCLIELPGGGGGTPHDGLYRGAPPERAT